MKKTQVLPPEEAVEIAWARTDELSSSESVRKSAEIPKKIMEDKLKRAEGLKDPNEKKYVESVDSAIEATYRNLATARNYLDLNFNETTALGQKHQEKFQNLEKFSGNLQSIVPKVAEMTIGGVTGSVLLSGLFENLFPASMNAYAMPLLLGLSASVAYFLHALVIVPFARRGLERQLMRTEFDKVQYFKQYVDRVSGMLKNLYERAENAHEIYFGNKYSTINPEDVVKKMLSHMQQDMCKNIEMCIKKNRAKSKQWSTCETGIDAEKCKHYNEQ